MSSSKSKDGGDCPPVSRAVAADTDRLSLSFSVSGSSFDCTRKGLQDEDTDHLFSSLVFVPFSPSVVTSLSFCLFSLPTTPSMRSTFGEESVVRGGRVGGGHAGENGWQAKDRRESRLSGDVADQSPFPSILTVHPVTRDAERQDLHNKRICPCIWLLLTPSPNAVQALNRRLARNAGQMLNDL